MESRQKSQRFKPGTKRKQHQTSEDTEYKNKYGVDYKRLELPIAVVGINECARQCTLGRLRILFIRPINQFACFFLFRVDVLGLETA